MYYGLPAFQGVSRLLVHVLGLGCRVSERECQTKIALRILVFWWLYGWIALRTTQIQNKRLSPVIESPFSIVLADCFGRFHTLPTGEHIVAECDMRSTRVSLFIALGLVSIVFGCSIVLRP